MYMYRYESTYLIRTTKCINTCNVAVRQFNSATACVEIQVSENIQSIVRTNDSRVQWGFICVTVTFLRINYSLTRTTTTRKPLCERISLFPIFFSHIHGRETKQQTIRSYLGTQTQPLYCEQNVFRIVSKQ